jgi:hypothetical protein
MWIAICVILRDYAVVATSFSANNKGDFARA